MLEQSPCSLGPERPEGGKLFLFLMIIKKDIMEGRTLKLDVKGYE